MESAGADRQCEGLEKPALIRRSIRRALHRDCFNIAVLPYRQRMWSLLSDILCVTDLSDD